MYLCVHQSGQHHAPVDILDRFGCRSCSDGEPLGTDGRTAATVPSCTSTSNNPVRPGSRARVTRHRADVTADGSSAGDPVMAW
ncbi:hypothetical protein BJF90_36145 [Pseudonocardia sp. CNS-004]|nr:hypothetical protein BJF90_36145 [Pseudonocardia sp. CNS-004]